MIVNKYQDVAAVPVKAEGAQAATIRWLIGEDSQAPHFHMRLFELAPGGHTPFHTHRFEHEVFVVEGKGELTTEDKPLPLEPGMFVLVMPEEKHQFVNTGDTPFKFLCMVPKAEICCK